MAYSRYETYVENRVLLAEPLELIRLLYQGAKQSVSQARRELEAGDIKARSREISRALQILYELSASLNHQEGGGVSTQLAALYDYMQRRLIDANANQQDEPLAEVLSLLSTLGEAWDGIAKPKPSDVPQQFNGNAFRPAFSTEVEPVSHSWSC